MIRREFITLLGGAAAWPLAARAQQGERVRRIGLLMGTADDREGQTRVAALKQGLQELGWTDGRNIQIETRFGGADAARIRAAAAELVALAPDVIVGAAFKLSPAPLPPPKLAITCTPRSVRLDLKAPVVPRPDTDAHRTIHLSCIDANGKIAFRVQMVQGSELTAR